jgi:HPt (histidine-containing phosphotransfer) domain-containing protein
MTLSPNNDVIDMRVVSQLIAHKRMGLSAFERLIPVFMEEAQMLIDQMRCAVTASDGEGLRLTAHKLKGSASVIGSLEIRALSQEVMSMTDVGNRPTVDFLIKMEQALRRFNDAACEIVQK